MDYSSSAEYRDEIDLLEVIRVIWSHRYLIIGSTVLITALAIVYALSATPVYRAHTIITQVGTESRTGGADALLGQFSGVAQMAGINFGGRSGSNQANGRVLVESRTFAEEFIKRYDLLPVLFADDWNNATKTWNDDLETEPAVWQGAHALQDAYQLELDRETGLFTLTVEWTDQKQVAVFANNMVALANEIARERDIASAERSVEFLNEQIANTNVTELQRVLYNLLESEQKTLMLANAREEYVFRVIDPALEPINRAKPNRRLIAILGVVVGFGFGLFLVAAIRVFHKVKQRSVPA